MKLLVLDGNSILNRAFYGIKLLSNKKGQYTNAIYGFLTTFHKLIEESCPDAIAVAFDLPAPTFRHKMFEGYKAQRKGMPDELASQLPIIRNLISLLGYKIVECKGYEADDILGTLAHSCSINNNHCVIATGDKDALQLVSKNTCVRIAATKFGKPESTLYDCEKIKEVYGVNPEQLIDIKALQGDTSDNIPGVKGIGQKTAGELIKKFGTLDKIYENINSSDIKDNLRKKLEDGKPSAYMSRDLGKICRDAPVNKDIKYYIPSRPDKKGAGQLLAQLEIFSLMGKLGIDNISEDDPSEKPEPASIKAHIVDNILKMEDFLVPKGNVNFLFITNKGPLDKIAILKDENVLLAGNKTEGFYEFTKQLLEKQDVTKTVYDIKSLLCSYVKQKIKIQGDIFDVMLAAYLLNPSSPEYSINRISQEYGIDVPLSVKGIPDDMQDYIKLATDISVLPSLKNTLQTKLKQNNQINLLYNIEQPLAEVLADMELAGFRVDSKGLLQYSSSISQSLDNIRENIYKCVGFEFNINSPKQLGKVLFEDLGLPTGKKGKSGYSTNAEILEKLKGFHPVADMVLEFRTLSKLKSTYCDGMLSLIGSDGRIRSSFNQTETRTGRISSTEPNLQNIPVRTELGRRLRKYFCAEDGCVLIDADYSQIELRVLAHISGDKSMIDAFKNSDDIHSITASQILGIPIEMVGSEARTRAKAVNFGIVYGIGAFSLSKDLGISRKEADMYIKSYLSKYSGIDNYMKQIVEQAKNQGFVETMFQRRRYLPELSSSNHTLRAFGERIARNMPIQGTAADIIKIAMINVHKRLTQNNMKSRLILQVHDELIVEAPIEESTQVKNIIKDAMEHAIELSVPLTVHISEGKTWYDSKE